MWAKLIIAVLAVEGGRVGQAKRNKNGTYDLGPMQINTSWWPRLYKYGVTPQEVLYNSCINVKVGAWILGKDIANKTDLLWGIGNYNSHNYILNQHYVSQIKINYTKLVIALTLKK